MKKLPVFRILSVLVLVFVTLAATHPASANTLEQFVVDIDQVFTTYDPICGFDVTYHYDGALRFFFHYDEYGELINSLDVWGNFKIDVSANGNTVNIQAGGPFQTTKVSDLEFILKSLGPTIVTIPGSGLVYGGAGQLLQFRFFDFDSEEWVVETIKQVGNYDFTGWELVCQYLAS